MSFLSRLLQPGDGGAQGVNGYLGLGAVNALQSKRGEIWFDMLPGTFWVGSNAEA